ncbi:hypothetical protein BDN72DRAFT_846379 [Pluteus cervinus]|uniref:Uncharacterized protein n=1 Tax=Pluteus cervinus TaxID=181527 RepID=A0ACD3AG04_9AGAR|nr:hypothetical protein BDN72DRAFT_846379 [Pluteus cervinus]
MSAKKKVLRSPELISQILDHLSLPICTLQDLTGSMPAEQCGLRASLLAAATCCRAFKEPALDALWRTMDSFEPILNMLPIVNRGVGILQLQDCTPKLWKTVRSYAARIRVFVYHRSLHQSLRLRLLIHASVFNALIARQQLLLPELRVLLIPCYPPEFLQSALYFVSPVLERVETGAAANFLYPFELEVFILTVTCRTDRLRHLSLSANPGNLSFSVLEAFLSPHLVTVTLRNPPKEALTALSSLPNLKDLAIWDAQNTLLGNTTSRGFRALEALFLHADAEFLLHFLNACSGRLRSVGFHITEGDNLQIKNIVDHLAKLHSKSLRCFGVSLYKGVMLKGNITVLFRPLFKIPLAGFHVYCGHNDTLKIPLLDIASKLSFVTYITLFPAASGYMPKFADLHSLAKTHPNLRCLEIALDIQDVLPLFPPTQHELDMLKIHDAPLLATNVRPVALQLDRLFPYLRVLQSQGPDPCRWKEVSDILEIFRLGRRGI